MLFGSECKADHHESPRRFTSMGWEIHAPGLARVLKRLSRLGLPLIVTENGIATTDETARTQYLEDHLATLAQSVRDGVPVIGYLYWTLMDNYEWAKGFDAKFGLAAVDFTTQERRPRPAAQAFRELIDR